MTKAIIYWHSTKNARITKLCFTSLQCYICYVPLHYWWVPNGGLKPQMRMNTVNMQQTHWYIWHIQTHPFNCPLSRTTRVSWYQKGKTILDFTEARNSEWQCNPLGHMQVCISLQTDNHASTPPLVFYRPGALPAAQPTVSKHWRHYMTHSINTQYTVIIFAANTHWK